MRDRLPDSVVSSGSKQNETPSRATNNPRQEAISALCSLGYKSQNASKMVQNIADEGKSCEDIIRLALQKINSK